MAPLGGREKQALKFRGLRPALRSIRETIGQVRRKAGSIFVLVLVLFLVFELDISDVARIIGIIERHCCVIHQ